MSPINSEDSSWKQLSWVNDEEVVSLSHAKVYVFSNSVLCLGKVNQNPNIKICLGRKVELVQRYTTKQNFGHWNSSGIFSQDSLHCSSSPKSKSSRPKGATHHNSKDDLSSCRCSMTTYGNLKTMVRNALLMPHLWLYLQEDFQQDFGHSSDLGQKRSDILPPLTDEENGTESLD